MQPRIMRLRREACDEWKRQGLNCTEKENSLRAVVTELMEIGQRNHELLQSLLQTAQSRLDQLGKAGHNLKRLRNSYAGHSAN
jgi:hypothetical protein